MNLKVGYFAGTIRFSAIFGNFVSLFYVVGGKLVPFRICVVQISFSCLSIVSCSSPLLTFDCICALHTWRYACWCEKTLDNKTQDIQIAEAAIEAAQEKILQLETATGTNEVEIQHLKKQISGLQTELAEALAMRTSEKAKAHEDGEEIRVAIESLDNAIQVLKAGTQKTSFLGALQQTQTLGLAASLRRVLALPIARDMLSDDEHNTMQEFISSPHMLSALQSGKEEDHSGIERITGICWRMLEDFMSELERTHGEDLQKEILYRSLKVAKEQELVTTEDTLAQTELTFAEDRKELGSTRSLRDDTSEQMEADKSVTKRITHDCQNKSVQWAEVSRFRTKTLLGIQKAIDVLSHDVFSSSAMFLQLSSAASGLPEQGKLNQALERLSSIVAAHPSLVQFTAGKKFAYFDEVVAAIDKMITTLHAEEKSDIAERDRCQNLQKNTQDGIEDDASKITTISDHVQRATASKSDLVASLTACENEKIALEAKVNESTRFRALAETEFKVQVRECNLMSSKIQEATKIVEKAIHESNPARPGAEAGPGPAGYRPELALLQVQNDSESSPYQIDEFKAPEADFDLLGSHKEEKNGVVAILTMIYEDNSKRCQDLLSINKQEDGDYDALLADLHTAYEEKTAICDDIEGQIVDLTGQITEHQSQLSATEASKESKQKSLDSMSPGCEWVSTTFDSRRTKRAAELAALQDAKTYLAGGTQQ